MWNLNFFEAVFEVTDKLSWCNVFWTLLTNVACSFSHQQTMGICIRPKIIKQVIHYFFLVIL